LVFAFTLRDLLRCLERRNLIATQNAYTGLAWSAALFYFFHDYSSAHRVGLKILSEMRACGIRL
jgi:hypothetical protein